MTVRYQGVRPHQEGIGLARLPGTPRPSHDLSLPPLTKGVLDENPEAIELVKVASSAHPALQSC